MPGVGVSGSSVSSEKRRGARGGKPEGSRNKRSVALASLIAVSPPAFEQEERTHQVPGGLGRGVGSKGRDRAGVGGRGRRVKAGGG